MSRGGCSRPGIELESELPIPCFGRDRDFLPVALIYTTYFLVRHISSDIVTAWKIVFTSKRTHRLGEQVA
eukprot:gene14821-biopygen4068